MMFPKFLDDMNVDKNQRNVTLLFSLQGCSNPSSGATYNEKSLGVNNLLLSFSPTFSVQTERLETRSEKSGEN